MDRVLIPDSIWIAYKDVLPFLQRFMEDGSFHCIANRKQGVVVIGSKILRIKRQVQNMPILKLGEPHFNPLEHKDGDEVNFEITPENIAALNAEILRLQRENPGSAYFHDPWMNFVVEPRVVWMLLKEDLALWCNADHCSLFSATMARAHMTSDVSFMFEGEQNVVKRFEENVPKPSTYRETPMTERQKLNRNEFLCVEMEMDETRDDLEKIDDVWMNYKQLRRTTEEHN